MRAGETPPGIVFVDADDTLWENNRYFTAVIAKFAILAEELGVPATRAANVLERIEERNIPVHGYGAAPFVISLRQAFAELLPGLESRASRRVEDFAVEAEQAIRDHPIVLLPGVAAGIRALAARCRLVVLTKGQEDEQRAKVERSGLYDAFDAVRVVTEKDELAYVAAAAAFDAPAETCWMIGNSASSDINPARRAGLRTVHVPHPAPWHRDEARIDERGPPTLTAQSFAEVPPLVVSL